MIYTNFIKHLAVCLPQWWESFLNYGIANIAYFGLTIYRANSIITFSYEQESNM